MWCGGTAGGLQDIAQGTDYLPSDFSTQRRDENNEQYDLSPLRPRSATVPRFRFRAFAPRFRVFALRRAPRTRFVSRSPRRALVALGWLERMARTTLRVVSRLLRTLVELRAPWVRLRPAGDVDEAAAGISPVAPLVVSRCLKPFQLRPVVSGSWGVSGGVPVEAPGARESNISVVPVR